MFACFWSHSSGRALFLLLLFNIYMLLVTNIGFYCTFIVLLGFLLYIHVFRSHTALCVGFLILLAKNVFNTYWTMGNLGDGRKVVLFFINVVLYHPSIIVIN